LIEVFYGCPFETGSKIFPQSHPDQNLIISLFDRPTTGKSSPGDCPISAAGLAPAACGIGVVREFSAAFFMFSYEQVKLPMAHHLR
jgi:hypothetical protein